MSRRLYRQKLAVLLLYAMLASVAVPPQFAAAPQSPSGKQSTADFLGSIEQDIARKNKPSEKTVDQLQQLLEREPYNARAHLVLGASLQSLGLPGQALDQFKIALKLSPNDPEALLHVAEMSIKLGHEDDVRQMIELGHEHFPADDRVQMLYATDLLEQGKIAHNRDLVKKSIKVLHALYAKNPNMPELNGRIAECLLNLNKPPEAVAFGCRELRQNPASHEANMVVGIALVSLMRPSQAVGFLADAFRMSPLDLKVSETLAKCAAWSGRYELALAPALTNIALTVEPHGDNPYMRRLLTDCIRHSPKTTVESTDKEFEQLDQARHNAGYQFVIGEALDECGYHELARAHYERAIKLEPSYPEPLFRLAQYYELQAHDYDKALEYYKKTQATSPSFNRVGDYIARLEDRLPARHFDLAWLLKDWLQSPHQ